MEQPGERRRQLEWDTAVAVALPPEARFAPQEHWAWARIIRGLRADMRFFPKDDEAAQASGANGPDDGAGQDPKVAESWPAHRDLSARFMRTVLFCEKWANARARPFVRIRAARFKEVLDWENESFGGEIELSSSRLDQDFVCRGLEIARLFDLQGSHLQGALRADRLVVEGSLFCRGGFSAKGDVRLLGARVAGQATFFGAQLEGALDADGMVVEGSLFFTGGFSAKGDIRLLGARVGGDVSFAGASLEGALRADRLTVGDTLFCEKGFSAKGDVRLLSARVGGIASFIGASLEGTLRADGLAVEGACYMRDMKKLCAADLLRARIGGNLQISRSEIQGRIDLTGAEIQGELNLAQSEGGGPIWGDGEDVGLVLRNAKAGALAGELNAFRRGKGFVPCDLAGFHYERIGGLGAGGAGSTLASAGGNDLRKWLKRCRARDHYDPAPYRALAAALDEAGRKDRAADVRNALGNYELVAKGTPLVQRFMLMLSWLFIGYGERNHRALIWFTALVVCAAVFGYWQDLLWAPDATPAGWDDRQAWFDWFGYAFADAVPLLVFDESHKTFLTDRFCGERTDGACTFLPPLGLTGFFYGVKIAGFVILSYLAAGLSGLAQRKD